MTKTKIFVSALGAVAAVMAAKFMKNRSKIKVQGEIETKNNASGLGGPGKKVQGAASVRVNPRT